VQHTFKRILLVRTDRLGDVILTLPMLSRLRRYFSGARLAMLLRHYTGAIVEGNPYADELLWYDNDAGLVPFFAMLRAIKERQYDAVILAHPTLRLGLLMWLAGIPVRVGTGYRYYSLLFTNRVFEHRKDARRHELEYNLNLLAELGCAAQGEDEQPEFGVNISPESDDVVRSLLHSLGVPSSRVTVVHPSSGGSARDWPLENFGALAAMLIDRNGASVVVTGGPGDEADAEKVVADTNRRAVSVAGKLQLKELAALIRSAEVFVSNSTGPLHLAVAVGTPVLAFYPQLIPMSVRRWGPYTDRKRVLVPDRPVDCRECSGRKGEPCACMASITIDQAYGALCELISERTSYPHGIVEHG
jgi:heptosyltransferase-3